MRGLETEDDGQRRLGRAGAVPPYRDRSHVEGQNVLEADRPEESVDARVSGQ